MLLTFPGPKNKPNKTSASRKQHAQPISISVNVKYSMMKRIIYCITEV
jgi:hypothetical protein